MNLLKAITTVGGYTMMSRVLGFVRDILIASVLGAGAVADCFFVAFRFPNLFRRLFAEGAFAAAFVPLFSGQLETDGRAAAKAFADSAFSVLLLALVVFVALMEVLMPFAMWILAPGFDQVPGKMALATELSRIAFPYLLFISLVSLQSGVLNSLHKFAAAAAAPVLLNITLIVAMLAFSDGRETAGHVLSWGVFAAGIVQFAWLVYHCRREGMPIGWVRPRLTPEVRLLGKRILPVVFGASLYQINLLIGTILASLVSDGAVSFLYYADRVTQLPLGVVGVAVGTALLPTLSRQLAAGDTDGATTSQNRGLEFALLLTLPAAVALFVIAEPVIAVLFERGAFTATDSAATAAALMAFATGLPAYVLIKVLTPGFFAREDTATPVKIAAAAMVTNIILNLVLMQVWGHVGIAIAASVSAWMNAIMLAVTLRRRAQLALDARMARRWPRIVAASLAMGAALYGSALVLMPWLTGAESVRATALALLVLGGLVAYGGLAQILGAAHWRDLKGLMRRAPGPDSAAA
ncbi:MAG: murein biosynthesis integral membrane protein MurJ [Rhodospirillaceae bacterium]|jgi:putative peptidoglycan lipid II flippase|nr:murein biosynthesis integral membrane protein MurJ [Rhodospirillaceae bacterium]